MESRLISVEDERFICALVDRIEQNANIKSDINKFNYRLLKDFLLANPGILNDGMPSMMGHPPLFSYLSMVDVGRQIILCHAQLIDAVLSETLYYEGTEGEPDIYRYFRNQGVTTDSTKLFAKVDPTLLNGSLRNGQTVIAAIVAGHSGGCMPDIFAKISDEVFNQGSKAYPSAARNLLRHFLFSPTYLYEHPELVNKISSDTLREYYELIRYAGAGARDWPSSHPAMCRLLLARVPVYFRDLCFYDSSIKILIKNPEWLEHLTSKDLCLKGRDGFHDESVAYLLLSRATGRELFIMNRHLRSLLTPDVLNQENIAKLLEHPVYAELRSLLISEGLLINSRPDVSPSQSYEVNFETALLGAEVPVMTRRQPRAGLFGWFDRLTHKDHQYELLNASESSSSSLNGKVKLH